MTDPIQTAETDVKADISKLKSIWASYEIWLISAACLILGAVVGYKLHP